MTNFDFSPLFRNAIGFDRVSRLIDTALTGVDQSVGYPPSTSKTPAMIPTV